MKNAPERPWCQTPRTRPSSSPIVRVPIGSAMFLGATASAHGSDRGNGAELRNGDSTSNAMKNPLKKISLSLLLALLAASAHAEVRLANVFGEHMVLQRDRPLQLWGQATPGQTLTVELAGRKASTRVGADGRWRVRLAPLPAGGPHRLRVEGDQTVGLDDVLIGDVWLLGGQSNMEWPLAQTDTGPQEVASPQNPQLRQLRVPLRASVTPEAEIAAAPWVVAEPGKVGEFSAVGYHFARQVQAVQDVPIGLIQTAWGGSMLETWVRRDAALQDPDLAPAVRALPADNASFGTGLRQRVLGRVAAWQPGLPLQGVDAGGWSAAADIDRDWPTLQRCTIGKARAWPTWTAWCGCASGWNSRRPRPPAPPSCTWPRWTIATRPGSTASASAASADGSSRGVMRCPPACCARAPTGSPCASPTPAATAASMAMRPTCAWTLRPARFP